MTVDPRWMKRRQQLNTRFSTVQRMRDAQDSGLLRQDIPPAHLLLIITNAITQWFEARAMFEGWSELQGADPDSAFLDSVDKVFFEGASRS